MSDKSQKQDQAQYNLLNDMFDKLIHEEGPEEPTPEQQLKYEEKLVAYIDLLGITQKIRETKAGKEDTIIRNMLKILHIIKNESKNLSSLDLFGN